MAPTTAATFDLNGIAVTLRDTRFAAEYSGAPASQLVTGLVQGFLTEADAEATMIPESIALVGGMQLSDARLPYISLLTDPTFGGISASFGMLGDLNIAEPGALIGFAGPRVIKETIKKDLPEGFQRSEFILEHGFLDFIVPRKELKDKLATVLSLFEN